MAVTKQFTQLDPINNGTTAADNFKLSDAIPAQHTDLTGGVNKLVHRTLAQSLCEPVAVCNSNNPSNGAYTATCQNYPDFALSYQDAQQNTQYLIGLKIRVIFTYGITYGSVSGGTYPTLNINGSGAIPMLAQGKTMASGAASAGQSIEFTIIPYGNGVAFDADSNVRESTSDYTIYTDGLKVGTYTELQNKQKRITYGTFFNIDLNTEASTTKSGTYTTTKDCLLRISNAGTSRASNEIAWARILINTQVIVSYSTTTYGSGQVIIVPAGVTISYDLHNNDQVQMQITGFYL